jgi:hypothetical protein
VAAGSQLQEVQLLHLDGVDSRDVSESTGQALGIKNARSGKEIGLRSNSCSRQDRFQDFNENHGMNS